jgi:hypothetical protein
MKVGHCEYKHGSFVIKCKRKTGGSPHTVVLVAADQRAFWCWRQDALCKRYPDDYNFWVEYQGVATDVNFHLVQQVLRPAAYTNGTEAVNAIRKLAARKHPEMAGEVSDRKYALCRPTEEAQWLTYGEAVALAEERVLAGNNVEYLIVQQAAIVRKPKPRAEVTAL